MTSLPTPPQPLSPRDYFAAMAMQGLLACETDVWQFKDREKRSEEAVQSADALIAELDKDSSPSSPSTAPLSANCNLDCLRRGEKKVCEECSGRKDFVFSPTSTGTGAKPSDHGRMLPEKKAEPVPVQEMQKL